MAVTLNRASAATVSFTTPQEIVISHLDDSIQIGDGTRLAVVTAANALKTDSSHVTQPVSASSLPLPAGAATETTLNGIKTHLESYGFSTASNTRPLVTTTSSVVLAANANRKYAILFNNSGTQIFLKLGTTAVNNQGIRLGPNVGYEITRSNLWLGSIEAVVASGSQNLDIFEGT